MSTPFGPQLIGEAEKTLNAILRQLLDPVGLSEPGWVTLRLASQLGATDDDLADVIAHRAHFANASQIVDQLTELELLERGRLTAHGREVLGSVQALIDETTAPIWNDLAAGDVAAAGRLLNEITRRGHDILATLP